MSRDEIGRAKQVLDELGELGQREVLAWLRTRHPVHKIEADWNAPAELILEAISRSGDISQRGVKGLIAEAAFELDVIRSLPPTWRQRPVDAREPFDFAIADSAGEVRIQVKLQRRERQVPKPWRGNPNLYVVETQRTRGGTSPTGGKTRPYRFGEFDVIAVCMQPCTDSWTCFRYSPQRFLLPHNDDPALLATYQPVALAGSDCWTSSLEECIAWLRSGRVARISET